MTPRGGIMKNIIFASGFLTFFILSLAQSGQTFPRLDMVVMDSSEPDPQFMGFVVDVDKIVVDPLVAARSFTVFTQIQGNETYTLLLTLNSSGIPVTKVPIFFAAQDCIGPAYFNVSLLNAELTLFDPHAIALSPIHLGTGKRLYASKRNTWPVENTIMQSQLLEGGVCTVALGAVTAVRADLVDDDFTATYKVPYKVIPRVEDTAVPE
jgi:hypothetical protein